MATGGLYGSSGTGALIAQPGSESSGLYGNSTSFGGTYFEWFVFQTSETQPATPTGGTWNFTTNANTPPTGWSSAPPSNPLNTVWVSIAIVNSKNTAPLVWSVPGKFAFSSGLPILFGNGAPQPGDGQSDQLYVQLDTTPQTIWAKETGTWTRLTGSTLYADLTSNQTIAGTKTFSSQIQGSISGTASNVTGTVAISNGGTGATTAASARAALGAAELGANADITSMTGVTGGISTPDFVQFDTGITPTVGVGKLQWDPTHGCMQVGLVGGNVNLQIGEETVAYVYNNTGSTITEGQVVRVVGSQGQRLTVALAQADGDPNSATILGMATENIANNSSGFITTQGIVNNLNTNGFADGTLLYLSPTVPGGVTATKPVAPQHLVWIGYVVKGNSGGAGSIYIHTQNGYELDELHNVKITDPVADNSFLVYDATLEVWQNEAPSAARTSLGLGSSAVLNAGAANGVATLDAGGTVPLSQIPASIQGGVSYQGTWNATTNTPTLTSSVGTKGYYYVVSVAGSTNLNGITSWNIGDWAIYNGTAWEKIDNTDAVTSVNGYTGTVVLNYADVGAPSTTGVNATGTWGINVTGNAATATTATNVSGGTASVTTLTTSSTVTLNGGTANGVAFLNASKQLTTGSVLTFDGATLGVNGVSVGRGAGAVSTNTAVGASALAANTTGAFNTAGGANALAANTTASASTAFGYNALALSTGDANNAFGRLAMPATTTGTNNAAFGNNTLQSNTTGSYNVALGANTLNANTTASGNTAVGYQAGYANTTGDYFTAIGFEAGLSNTTSTRVTAVGSQALRSNTTGRNTAFGWAALYTNTTGTQNTALGDAALYSATTADGNTAVGYGPLLLNTTGAQNTAVGTSALRFNTTASNNTAVGYQSMYSNTTGTANVALGFESLYSNTTGNSNTAIGRAALRTASTTSNNTAVGLDAGRDTTGADNSILGWSAMRYNSTGASNTAVGSAALFNNSTASNNTALGYQAAYSNTTGYDNTAAGFRALYANTTGAENTAMGRSALAANTTGSFNTAFGIYALLANTTGTQNTAVGRYTLQAVTTGNNNTAMGNGTAQAITTGVDNTAIGEQALYNTTTASYSTAIGRQALWSNTTATGNTAVGYQSTYANTTGTGLVATGYGSLLGNTTGGANTAMGYLALASNTTASYNTAVGYDSLRSNTTASGNTAVGFASGYSNTTGASSTVIGYQAGYSQTVGGFNTFIGREAGFSSNHTATSLAANTAVGYAAGYSLTTGTYNTFIGVSNGGYGAGHFITTGSKNTILGGYSGNQGGLDIRTANNRIVLSDGDGNPRMWCDSSGNWYVTGSSGFWGSGSQFIVRAGNGGFYQFDGANYYLVTTAGGGTSDATLKKNVKTLEGALDKLCAIRGVSFEFIEEPLSAPDKGVQIGVIAQEVETQFPETVVTSSDGIKSVRYDRLVAPLIEAIKELKAEFDAYKASHP